MQKFRALVPTALLVKFTQQGKYILVLRLSDSSRPINLLKMAVESLSLAKFPSTEASNFWAFLTILGEMKFRFLRMSWLPLVPMVGGTTILPIRNGPLSRGDLTTMSPSLSMVPSLTVLLTCPGVRRTRAMLCAVYVINLFILGVMSA